MPQKLLVKVTAADGTEVMQESTVLRMYGNIGGAQIFLHTNGVYGYKSGAPIRSVEELNIIGKDIQKRAALAWWERAGRQLSEDYYADQEERERQRQGDYHMSPEESSDLDACLYYRTLVVEEGGEQPQTEGPFSWMELFQDKRPDWWGLAQQIQFQDYVYQMEAAPPVPEAAPAAISAPEAPQPEPEKSPADAPEALPPEPEKSTADPQAPPDREEEARQELLGIIRDEFPEATVHPATGLPKLQQKYQELKAQAASNAGDPADQEFK